MRRFTVNKHPGGDPKIRSRRDRPMTTAQNLSRPMRPYQSELMISSLRKRAISSPKTTPPEKVFDPKAFQQRVLLPADRKDSLLFPQATSSKDVFTTHGPKFHALVQNLRYRALTTQWEQRATSSKDVFNPHGPKNYALVQHIRYPRALTTQTQSNAVSGQNATLPSLGQQGQKTFFAVTPVIHRRNFEEFAENEVVPTQASEGRIPGAFPIGVSPTEPKNYALVQNIRYPRALTTQTQSNAVSGQNATLPSLGQQGQKTFFAVTPVIHRRNFEEFAENEVVPTQASEGRIPGAFSMGAFPTEPKYPVRAPMQPEHSEGNILARIHTGCAIAAKYIYNVTKHQTHRFHLDFVRDKDLATRTRNRILNIFQGTAEITERVTQANRKVIVKSYRAAIQAVDSFKRRFVELTPASSTGAPQTQPTPATRPRARQPRLPRRSRRAVHISAKTPAVYPALSELSTANVFGESHRAVADRSQKYLTCDLCPTDMFPQFTRENALLYLKTRSSFVKGNGQEVGQQAQSQPVSSNVCKGKGKAAISQPAPQTQSVSCTFPVAESSSGTSDSKTKETIQQSAIQQKPVVQHTVPVPNTDGCREPARKLKPAERSSPLPDPATLEPSGNAPSEEMELLVKRLSDEVRARWKPHSLRDQVMDELSQHVVEPWIPNSPVTIKDWKRQEDIEREIKTKEQEVERQAQLLKEAEEATKRAEKDSIAEEKIRKAEEAEAQWLQHMGREKVPAGKDLITHLPDEWQQKVRSAMSKSMNHEVAIVSNGTKLSRRDFGKVLPQEGTTDDSSAWLNDEIIAAYLQLVVNYGLEKTNHRRGQTPRFHAFNSFFYKNLSEHGPDGVKRWANRAKIGGRALLDVDTIFIPVNSGLHWTLIVVSPKRRVIEYFDSLSRGNVSPHSTLINNIKRWLVQELADDYVASEWTAKIVADGPQQNNSSDCGVFTVTTAKMVMLGWDPRGAYQASHIPLQRKRILAELIQGGWADGLEPVESQTVAWEIE